MMRELTAFRNRKCLSGAGWLQDGLAALGSKVSAAAWTMGTDALSINLPLLGTLNLADLAPDWAQTLGESVRSTIGGTIEECAGRPARSDRRPAGTSYSATNSRLSQHEKGACFQALFVLIQGFTSFPAYLRAESGERI